MSRQDFSRKLEQRSTLPPVAVCKPSETADALPPRIVVIDDEFFARQAICALLSEFEWRIQSFASCEEFLENYCEEPNTCLVLDMHLPGMSGLELIARLATSGNGPQIVVVSGKSGLSEAVSAMKAGVVDFIEKPVARDPLLAGVVSALGKSRRRANIGAVRLAAHGHLTDLTSRQHEIMDLVLAGCPSKNIAADLGISQRTVESHRASIMERTGAHSLPGLAQLVMCDRCTLIS